MYLQVLGNLMFLPFILFFRVVVDVAADVEHGAVALPERVAEVPVAAVHGFACAAHFAADLPFARRAVLCYAVG